MLSRSIPSEDMPLCYCCSLPTGMHSINAGLFALSLLDTLFYLAVMAANAEDGLPLYGNDRYFSYGLYCVWGLGLGCAAVGATALNSPPSKNRSLMLKVWRAGVMCFMVLWFFHKCIAVYRFRTIEWVTLLQSARQSTSNIVPSSWADEFFWFIWSYKSFPLNWILFLAFHSEAFIYFSLIWPLGLLGVGLVHMNTFFRLTKFGTLTLADGISKARDMRKRKQQERRALLQHKGPKLEF